MTLILSALISWSPLASAGDYPGMTMATYCSVPFSPSPLVVGVARFYTLDDVKDAGQARRAMAEKVFKTFVKPALVNGCRDKGLNGWDFTKNVLSACESGCDQAISDFADLTGTARADLITICKADCRAGGAWLSATAVGYDTAKSGR